MKFHNVKRIAIIIIAILFGCLIGFYIGTYVTIKSVANIASRFVNVDYELMKNAILYEDYIIDRFPLKI